MWSYMSFVPLLLFVVNQKNKEHRKTAFLQAKILSAILSDCRSTTARIHKMSRGEIVLWDPQGCKNAGLL